MMRFCKRESARRVSWRLAVHEKQENKRGGPGRKHTSLTRQRRWAGSFAGASGLYVGELDTKLEPPYRIWLSKVPPGRRDLLLERLVRPIIRIGRSERCAWHYRANIHLPGITHRRRH